MAEAKPKKACRKCGRKISEELNFYMRKDGNRADICKKCYTMHMNCFEPDTFLWAMKDMDIPYIPSKWHSLRDKALQKAGGDPRKVSSSALFGKYIASMKIKPFDKLTWADSGDYSGEEQANIEAYNKEHAEELAAQDAILKEKLELGQISEAEYRTMSSNQSVDARDAAKMYETPEISAIYDANTNLFNEEKFMSESEIPDPGADLTTEDKLHLVMKWGRYYTPAEWVALETDYDKYMRGFDIQDPDTIKNLLLLCKTNLKANAALDSDDYDGFKKLQSVADSLRKSMKLTAAQNKEGAGNFLDAVGELVAYCEKTGGEIPRLNLNIDRDIIDSVIRDLKTYNRDLIYDDPALARQIEDYIAKKESFANHKRDVEEAKKENRDLELSDQDHIDFIDMVRLQQEKDKDLFE